MTMKVKSQKLTKISEETTTCWSTTLSQRSTHPSHGTISFSQTKSSQTSIRWAVPFGTCHSTWTSTKYSTRFTYSFYTWYQQPSSTLCSSVAEKNQGNFQIIISIYLTGNSYESINNYSTLFMRNPCVSTLFSTLVKQYTVLKLLIIIQYWSFTVWWKCTRKSINFLPSYLTSVRASGSFQMTTYKECGNDWIPGTNKCSTSACAISTGKSISKII